VPSNEHTEDRKPAPNDGSLEGLRKKPNPQRKVDLGRWTGSVETFGFQNGEIRLRPIRTNRTRKSSKRREPATEWQIERKLRKESTGEMPT